VSGGPTVGELSSGAGVLHGMWAAVTLVLVLVMVLTART
jgi:hypothetical protein